jgi:hypothetical protein
MGLPAQCLITGVSEKLRPFRSSCARVDDRNDMPNGSVSDVTLRSNHRCKNKNDAGLPVRPLWRRSSTIQRCI